MLYIATIPGFIISLGMQFAVESPRWLCKVGLCFNIPCISLLLLLDEFFQSGQSLHCFVGR